MSVLARVATFGLLIGSGDAWASGMLEPHRAKLTVSNLNGDSVTLSCPPDLASCVATARVNGKRFKLSAADVGANITAEGAVLYSGEYSGRDRYFSLSLAVKCPERPQEICEAEVVMEQGKSPVVTIGKP